MYDISYASQRSGPSFPPQTSKDVSLREPVNIKLNERSYVSVLEKRLAFRLYVRASCLTITRPNASIDYLSWLFSTIVPYSQVKRHMYTVSSTYNLFYFVTSQQM